MTSISLYPYGVNVHYGWQNLTGVT